MTCRCFLQGPSSTIQHDSALRQRRSVSEETSDKYIENVLVDEEDVLRWIVEESASLLRLVQLMKFPEGTEDVPGRSCLDIHLDHEEFDDGEKFEVCHCSFSRYTTVRKHIQLHVRKHSQPRSVNSTCQVIPILAFYISSVSLRKSAYYVANYKRAVESMESEMRRKPAFK